MDVGVTPKGIRIDNVSKTAIAIDEAMIKVGGVGKIEPSDLTGSIYRCGGGATAARVGVVKIGEVATVVCEAEKFLSAAIKIISSYFAGGIDCVDERASAPGIGVADICETPVAVDEAVRRTIVIQIIPSDLPALADCLDIGACTASIGRLYW